jgi:hypothetical protein
MTIYTLENIRSYQVNYSIIIKQKLVDNNSKPQYQLLNANGLVFKLSNNQEITIPHGFTWDGSSVPRFLWLFFSTDGDFEIASLIHDYLYENRMFDRKLADKEMLKLSIAVNGMTNKFSYRNFDN